MTVHLGFIGAGNMGGAMIAGLAPQKNIKVWGFDPDQEKLEALARSHGLTALGSALEVAEKCEYIFYAVKPGLLEKVIQQTLPALCASKCLVSIAAGINISRIISWSDNRSAVVRIMPNTPALIGKGVFALCLEHEKITSQQKEFLTNAVCALGSTFVLPEKSFDVFTALIGSGPAYIYYFMESMIEAGVLLGLERNSAARMVKELFAGSSEMSLEQKMHITQLKEMVTSPGGTTMAGLSTLDQKAVKASIIKAVEKAMKKSIELGK
ncbi:MAG: pyrroline-5-carboxylate reductase [Desulfonatronovibrio sp.]